jgi:alpha-glucosidase
MDQKNRIAVILNQDSRSHMVTIPDYQVSMTDGSGVTDQLTGNNYQVRNEQVTVDVRGEGGVVLVQ